MPMSLLLASAVSVGRAVWTLNAQTARYHSALCVPTICLGSHCAVSLARSGVGHLRLIDFDQVSVSSLNRCVGSCFYCSGWLMLLCVVAPDMLVRRGKT